MADFFPFIHTQFSEKGNNGNYSGQSSEGQGSNVKVPHLACKV